MNSVITKPTIYFFNFFRICFDYAKLSDKLFKVFFNGYVYCILEVLTAYLKCYHLF